VMVDVLYWHLADMRAVRPHVDPKPTFASS
jgi:hypothetical protein